jgi:predicted MFS family arabinose efflux permease
MASVLARPDRPQPSGTPRGVLPFLCATCVVEAATVQVMVPLLPELLREFRLSESMGGWMTSAFWVGGIAGTFPPLLLIEHIGPRRITIYGLYAIVISVLMFGLADSAASVMAARFLGGMAATTAWAGAYTWLMLETPLATRGRSFATIFTASYVGLLVGPVLGAAAAELDRAMVCTGLAVAVLPLALLGSRLPVGAGVTHEPRQRSADGRAPRVADGLVLIAMVGCAGGAILVLAPLRLADVGASASVIAAVLWAAYIPRIIFSHASGRILDRHGPALVIVYV